MHMNRAEWRAFAEQTKTEQGAIVATKTLISQSLVDDPCLSAIMRHEALNAARDFYDRNDCEYTYLTPTDYAYQTGPFVGFDIPEGMAVVVGRVRVRRI